MLNGKQFDISLTFHSISNIVRADRTTSKKDREASNPVSAAGDRVARTPNANYGSGMTSTSNLLPILLPNIPQPKVDTTDRRHIEAQSEDKSHTTKETLDDIKHTRQKEERKKEQANLDRYGINNEGLVSKTLI